MIQVLSNLTKFREYGCRICPVTYNMVKTMNKANKQLTSLKIWMEGLLFRPLVPQ